ncbi:MAG: PA14 domain-containing protein [Victivallales bacterium]
MSLFRISIFGFRVWIAGEARLNICLLLFLSGLPLLAEWNDPNAKFRLEVKPEKPDVVLYIDLHGMIFPSTLEKGVTAYTDGGRKIPLYLDKESLVLFTGGVSTDEKLFIYFGFDELHPFDCWNVSELGKVPETQKLRLRIVADRISPQPESDMLANSNYQKYLEMKKLGKEVFSREQKLAILKKKPDSPQEQKEKADAEMASIEEMKAELKNMEKAIPAAELKKFKDREREVEKFFKPEAKAPESTTVKKVFIDQNPTTKNKNYSAQFTGRLLITDPGIYVFAVNSRGPSHLVIDDNPVADWPYRHDKADGWYKTGEVYLESGLHPLSFYFQKGKGGPYASAAWKKPGEQDFKILEEKDFSPAYRASIINCSDKEGAMSPIVRYKVNGYFFIDREHKADWLECEVEKAGSNFTPLWKVDGDIVSENTRVSFAPERNSDSRIFLSSKEKAFPDIKIEIPADLLKESDNNNIEPDIFMRSNLPLFIFDDEILEMTMEIISNLPVENRALLRIRPDHGNQILRQSSTWIDLEPRKKLDTDPFAQPFVFKKQIELNGESIARDPLRLKFTLSVPPLQISDETIRFVPLADCPELKYDAVSASFLDTHGKKVVPVLHRLTLSEKRTWSFAQSLLKEIAKTRKMLVIADDFSENESAFSGQLGKLLKSNKTDLEFVAWGKKDETSTMTANFGSVIRAISSSNADEVLIIPSVWDSDMGIPARLQMRTLSAIIQAAQSNKSVRTVILATPYPSLEDNPDENELVRGIRNDLKRDYGIEKIIDLNSFLREKDKWKSLYRNDTSSSALYLPFPVQYITEICQKILDAD